MAVTPTGSPAWVRNADHTSYGGHVDKINYQGQPLVNPRTDFGAEALARLAADLAAVVRTGPFSVVTYLCNDSSPAAPTIETVNQMTGVRTASYAGDAAPAGFPSAARNGTGDVTFTWATSYDDPYGVAGAIDISHVMVTGHSLTGPVIPSYELVSAGVIRVRLFDAAGVALADDRATVRVWT